MAFEKAQAGVPVGVSLGIRIFENLDPICLFLDFSFQVSGLTSTGFVMNGAIGGTYPMNLSKVVLDYITATNPFVFTYSILQNTSFDIDSTSNTSQIVASWPHNSIFPSTNSDA